MAVPNIPGWQQAILRGVGAPATAENIKYLNAWAQAEGGNAANNPFNTTQTGPGAVSNYNSVGVKNFNSPMAGIQATIATLKNGHYGPILAALARGNSAMADAQAESMTPWGTGSLIEKVLGGRVTGGVPTSVMQSGGPQNGLQALTGAIMGGGLPQMGLDPITAMLTQIMQSNKQLGQQQLPGFIPFGGGPNV